jgi:hypothetical protein
MKTLKTLAFEKRVGRAIALSNIDDALCEEVVGIDRVHDSRHLHISRDSGFLSCQGSAPTSMAIWWTKDASSDSS